MSKLSVWTYRWLALIHDAAWVPVALLMAFLLRFNLEGIPDPYVSGFWLLTAVAVPVQLVSFHYFGLYRGIWRFASIPDLIRILQAVITGALVTFLLLFVWQRLEGIPRSVTVLYPVLLIAGLAIPRLFYRWLKDRRFGFAPRQGKRALIVGAGRAGELLVRDLLKDGQYIPVAFLDDNRKKHGLEIHGVQVVAGSDAFEEQVRALNIEIVLLAVPTASATLMRKLLDKSLAMHVPCRTLPSLSELAEGKVEVGTLREIRIEDLLGREEIRLDDLQVREFLKDKRVLITGAGGSIGSEFCRQVAEYQPEKLIMVDHGEYNLYQIDAEMRAAKDGLIVSLLGDIRDESRMRWIFDHYRPHVVFNAAAYKHVPLVEENPAEGVKTNVLGTSRIADIAVETGCEKFVQISTDKAVNPTNVMGASKRAAEIYCQNLNGRSPGTAFITTRFGNVLGSAGSVVPLFEKQIKQGGPVTVTHPEITRYFMTIPEAVRLILQAGSMGKGGEIFVLDMGEPIKIVDLAEQMIHLFGMEAGKDIEIRFTGLRPGEKLYEELFHQSEALIGTTHPKIMLSASREVAWDEMQSLLEKLRGACAEREVDQVRALLHELVPEFIQQTVSDDTAKPDGAMLH
ncbi:MAG: nucleoside-diphosphate sugar epimerase/dehydratase [Mariprofundaceae bacterium]|nr:nucleoside-diphosphate sugar epimerase/dehydratase [Mariprofundaceae bacterium]